ncbi:MAG: LicD family protein [Clostridia bacterium]|nr:LicD family protein [Clostridia bacterium]
MNELQSKLVEMLRYFHEVCVENDIRYYMVEGSFLGAVRHKGFIPWDDDIDLGVPREDYDRLIEVFKRKDHKRYVLEVPGEQKDFVYPYGKLYDTETTLVEKTRYTVRRGIYLDIFPLDGAGDTKEDAKQHCRRITMLDNYACTKICALDPKRKFYKNAAIVAGRCIPEFLFGWRWAQKKAEVHCRKKTFDGCKYVSNMYSTWREKEIMERAVYGEPTLYEFEGLEVYGPQNADRYLSSLYGNYMQLPPEEKRISHHDYVFLDLEGSYQH